MKQNHSKKYASHMTCKLKTAMLKNENKQSSSRLSSALQIPFLQNLVDIPWSTLTDLHMCNACHVLFPPVSHLAQDHRDSAVGIEIQY